MRTVAVLFTMTRSPYLDAPGTDCWDEARDARLYAGPHPVVAHPPCSRWCRLAGLVQARWGYQVGDDGGTFAAALAAVRRWGGVLEHPAYSHAWGRYDLPVPVPGGGWQRGLCGGWVCHVEQWHYGHRAKKATWLYSYGCELPSMEWGTVPDTALVAYVTDGGGDMKRRHPVRWRCSAKRHRRAALISWCGNKTAADEDRPRLGKREANCTPAAFRDLLLAIARTSTITADATRTRPADDDARLAAEKAARSVSGSTFALGADLAALSSHGGSTP